MTKQEKTKDARLRREFHITLDEYKAVLKFQLGSCAICGKKLNKKGKPLQFAVDHCHVSGKLRGILCWPCNKGIGVFRDNADWLKNAANYINSPPFSQMYGERFTAPGAIGTKARTKLLAAFNAVGKGNEQKSRKGRKK